MAAPSIGNSVEALEIGRGEGKLLPQIVDETAETNPESVYAELPVSKTGYDLGSFQVTYKTLANAVNGLAWFLTNTLGSGQNFDTLVYFGPNDIRCSALVLGAVKAGYKILLASPRNQINAYVSLLTDLDCKALLCAETPPAVATEIQSAYPLPVFQVPSVESLMETKYGKYEYSRTLAEAHGEPFVVLHTSGTTSTPKPIVYTHGWVASFLRMCRIAPPPGTHSQPALLKGKRVLVLFPQFHAGHLWFTLLYPVASQTTAIFAPTNTPPSASLVTEAITKTQIDVCLSPPHVLREIAVDPKLLDIVSHRLATFFYAGGNVPEAIGTTITSSTSLMTIYGATELGLIPSIRLAGPRQPDEWSYVRMHPLANFEFRPFAKHNGEDIYEAFIIRNKRPEDEQPVFKLFPEHEEYSTRDLFTQHPSKPGVWRHYGRVDDTIVLATGLNVTPLPMESRVMQHPEISGALMVGTNRMNTALLVELKDVSARSTCGSVVTLDDIWSWIEEINGSYNEAFRVHRSRILITPPNKRMQRSAKGSVQRFATETLFSSEIDKLCLE